MKKFRQLDQWVLCRIYRKSCGVQHQKPSALNSRDQTHVAAAPSTHSGLQCYRSKLNQLIANPVMDPYLSYGLQDSTAVSPLCHVDSPSKGLGGSCVAEGPSFCQSRHQQQQQPPPLPQENLISQGGMVVTEQGIRQRRHRQDDSAMFSRVIQSMAGGGLDGSFGLCWQ